MQVPMMAGGALVAPALVQQACGTLEGRLVLHVCQFWRVFLSRTLQLARSPQDHSDNSSAATRCYGMSFDHHVFVPTWCDWVRPSTAAARDRVKWLHVVTSANTVPLFTDWWCVHDAWRCQPTR